MSVRPNYFVAIRLACPVFADVLLAIQDQVIQRAPHLCKCRMHPKKLHLTCFVLTLGTTEQIDKAAICLEAFQAKLVESMSDVERKEIHFNSVGNFTNKVLYASPTEDDVVTKLALITRQLEDYFAEQGLLAKTQSIKNTWQPHATILKTSYDRKNGRKIKINAQDCAGLDTYFNHPLSGMEVDSNTDGADSTKAETVKDLSAGSVAGSGIGASPGIRVPLTTIDLLSMQEVQEDGYYRSYAKIFF